MATFSETINYMSGFCDFLRQASPDEIKSFSDSLSQQQITSKYLLTNGIIDASSSYPAVPNIVIVGGWYGTLLVPMLNHLLPRGRNITLTDKDQRTIELSKLLHKNSIKYDVVDVENNFSEVLKYKPHIIINTACEHMADLKDVINRDFKNILFALQTTDDSTSPGHINPSADLTEFVAKSGLAKVLYSNSMQVINKKRLTLLGFI